MKCMARRNVCLPFHKVAQRGTSFADQRQQIMQYIVGLFHCCLHEVSADIKTFSILTGTSLYVRGAKHAAAESPDATHHIIPKRVNFGPKV